MCHGDIVRKRAFSTLLGNLTYLHQQSSIRSVSLTDSPYFSQLPPSPSYDATSSFWFWTTFLADRWVKPGSMRDISDAEDLEIVTKKAAEAAVWRQMKGILTISESHLVDHIHRCPYQHVRPTCYHDSKWN